MSDFKRSLSLFMAGRVGPGVVRTLHRTLSVRVEGTEHYERLRDEGSRVLFAVWHGRMLTPVWWHRNQGITVLVSEHSDGEVLARIMSGLGFGSVRGSSTRGGVRGLKGLVRAARAGHDLAITPDGPRGPSQVVKSGLIVASQLTGAPIVPLSAAARKCWRLGSWDAFQLPKPRSEVLVKYGPPVHVPEDTDEMGRQHRLAVVQESLDTLTAQVDLWADDRGSDPESLERGKELGAAVD